MPGGFGRKRAREQQRVRVDGNGLMRAAIGTAGLGDEELGLLRQHLADRSATLERQRRPGFGTLPGAKSELKSTIELANLARREFDDLVVLGSSEVALGIHALMSATAPVEPPKEAKSRALRLHVVSDLDPERFAALLTRLDLRRTLFNIVGDSTESLPTISHFLIVRDRLLKEVGALAYKHHVVVSTPDEGPLRQIVNDEGFRDLRLPITGLEAFGLLTPSALFPAACAGTEITNVVAGATDMLERCRDQGDTNPAYLFAIGILRAGTPGPHVPVPARAAVQPLATWIEQRCSGRTPADITVGRAEGGVTLFLAVEPSRQDLEIPKAYQDIESVGSLGGRGLGALAAVAAEATELALWRAGAATMTLRFPMIDAHIVGQVVFLVEAALALACATSDASSLRSRGATGLAYGLIGRPGYEAERADVQRWAARREARYVA